MEPRSKKARFGEVSEDAELQALDARTPMSTKTATTFWLGVFESSCVEKEIVLDLNLAARVNWTKFLESSTWDCE